MLGTRTMSQHNIFYLEKIAHIFLVLLTGFEPTGSLELESDSLPIEPPRHPLKNTQGGQAIQTFAKSRSRSRKKWTAVIALAYYLLSC